MIALVPMVPILTAMHDGLLGEQLANEAENSCSEEIDVLSSSWNLQHTRTEKIADKLFSETAYPLA